MIGPALIRRATTCLCLLVALTGCATIIDERTEVAVPVSAVLDPTSRLFHMDQIVVMGYLRCFDDLSRLYATYDEAQRSALLNSITIVRESGTDDDTDSCPAEGEIELALCMNVDHGFVRRVQLPREFAATRPVRRTLADRKRAAAMQRILNRTRQTRRI